MLILTCVVLYIHMIEYHQDDEREQFMKVFTVINQKGGTGKTTLSLFLAQYYGQARKERVLCIDLDPQCNFSNLFLDMELGSLEDISPRPFIPPIHPDFEEGDDQWDGRSSSADIWLKGEAYEYPTRFDNISIIPGHSQDLKLIEERHDLKSQIKETCRDFISNPEMKLSEDFDIVIIDTSPELKPVTLSGLHAATHILIPTEMTELGTQGLAGMLAHYNSENNERSALNEDPVKLVGVLANKFKKQGSGHASFYKAIRESDELGGYLMDNFLPQYSAYENATRTNAASIFASKPSALARKALERVCVEIIERMEAK